ncbi:MAG: type II toxin-antitoxin system VapC family toxin [bacterium]|nr:type II toxin-antitoxin system VapC family toxin [bacterium]
MVYLDTSVLVKLYFKEEYSREASTWLRSNKQAIPLTRFHELEFINAIQLKQFRAEITENETELVISRFDGHEKRGVYYRPQLEWPNVFNIAMGLSKNFSNALGSRSLDILHVASALSIKADKFLTLDQRQSELARSVGLKIKTLSKGN